MLQFGIIPIAGRLLIFMRAALFGVPVRETKGTLSICYFSCFFWWPYFILAVCVLFGGGPPKTDTPAPLMISLASGREKFPQHPRRRIYGTDDLPEETWDGDLPRWRCVLKIVPKRGVI